MLEGATRIIDLDGEEMFCPINMDRLWKYNIWKEKEKEKEKEKSLIESEPESTA